MKSSAFGHRLRSARQQKGVSLRELSSRTGISYSHLSRLERQKHLPRATDVEPVAAALGVRSSEFLEGFPDQKAPPGPLLIRGGEEQGIVEYPVLRRTHL